MILYEDILVKSYDPNERKNPSFSVEGKADFRGGYFVQRLSGSVTSAG